MFSINWFIIDFIFLLDLCLTFVQAHLHLSELKPFNHLKKVYL